MNEQPRRRGRPPKVVESVPPGTVRIVAQRGGLWSHLGRHEAGEVVEVQQKDLGVYLATGFWKEI